MRRLRWVAAPVAMMLALLLPKPAFAAGTFRRVHAEAQGPSLFVTFTESGLQPGQNYAYLVSGTATETFQCYRSRTFTPTHKTLTLGPDAGDEDPRGYTANANGVVHGFTYLYTGFTWPDFCPAHQEVVPVFACFMPRDLVQFIDPFDVYWFPEDARYCGPIEPD